MKALPLCAFVCVAADVAREQTTVLAVARGLEYRKTQITIRGRDFGLIPGPVQQLASDQRFESVTAVLTRGRWADEWVAPPERISPAGVVLAAEIPEGPEEDDAWLAIAEAMGGTLCGSFAPLARKSLGIKWIRPARLPWAPATLYSTNPYEAVCTENLSPLLDLTPCGTFAGHSAMWPPLDAAESHYLSLRLDLGRTPAGETELNVTVAAVGTFARWRPASYKPCPLISASLVRTTDAAGTVERPTGDALDSLRPPQEPAQETGPLMPRPGMNVVRDFAPIPGRPERSESAYTVRLVNGDVRARSVNYHDRLPFFMRPLWHTAELTELDQQKRVVSSAAGDAALSALQARVEFTDGVETHSALHFAVDVAAGATVTLQVQVIKSHPHVSCFWSACEKGYDVGSAVYVLDAPVASGARTGALDTEYMTPGALVMVPMPDFSMPFNVIALSATGMTLSYASLWNLGGATTPKALLRL